MFIAGFPPSRVKGTWKWTRLFFPNRNGRLPSLAQKTISYRLVKLNLSINPDRREKISKALGLSFSSDRFKPKRRLALSRSIWLFHAISTSNPLFRSERARVST